MKNIIFNILIFVCSFNCYSQNFEIINHNTDAKLVIKGNTRKFLIEPFAICPYDSITYIVYQNWCEPNITRIDNFEYSKLHKLQNCVSKEFKQKLRSSIDNIDEQCDGLMINSENFQALQLLQDKYKKQRIRTHPR